MEKDQQTHKVVESKETAEDCHETEDNCPEEESEKLDEEGDVEKSLDLILDDLANTEEQEGDVAETDDPADAENAELGDEERTGENAEDGDAENPQEETGEGEGKDAEGENAEDQDPKNRSFTKWERDYEDMDPSKGFLEGEQEKMVSAPSWKYRIKCQPLESRDLKRETFEKMANICINSAIYFINRGAGKKMGKFEGFLPSQASAQLMVVKALKLDYAPHKTVAMYIKRRIPDSEDFELAYMKVYSYVTKKMHYRAFKNEKNESKNTGAKASTRSVHVSNIPEGTSEDLLRVLFPCNLSIEKAEESEGESAGSVMVECANRHTAALLVEGYFKVQIGTNVLKIRLFSENKPSQETAEEDGGKKVEEKNQDAEEEEGGEGKYKNKKNRKRNQVPTASRKNRNMNRMKQYVRGRNTYQNSSNMWNRGGRMNPRNRGFQSFEQSGGFGGRSFGANEEQAQLRNQIALLQENLDLLSQGTMNPMMMSNNMGFSNMGGQGMMNQTSLMGQQSNMQRNRRRNNRRSSGGDYSRDNYGFMQSDVGSFQGEQYGSSMFDMPQGGSSWSGNRSDYFQDNKYGGFEGSRKRPYNWEDDYRGNYKKFH